MLVNLVHHQIAIEYVPTSSRIVSVIYKKVYSERNEVAPDRISDRTPAKSILQYNPPLNSKRNYGFKVKTKRKLINHESTCYWWRRIYRFAYR